MNLLAAIKGVPDHRHPRGIRHPKRLILTIILLGSCAGYWGYKPLVEFTKNHRSTLIKIWGLPPEIRFPSDSTFRNIIHSLDFEVIAVLFNVWSQQTLPLARGELMAIDGKIIKSTLVGGNSSYQNFVSMLSVYSHERGWVVRDKVMENHHGSEIEVVEELVKKLGFSDSNYSGCTALSKKTSQLIIEGRNDYIIAIKKNQSNLWKTAQKLTESASATDSFQTSERWHGRTTTRSTTIYPIESQLLPLWAGTKHIILLSRAGTRWQGKKSRRRLVDFHELHYYLSSLDWSAREFSEAIRGHWLIENRLHWVKDVTLNEDNCIHRGDNAPANWAMVRQFLVSLARMSGTNTLPQALRLMANQIENISELLFGFCPRDKPVKSRSRASANSPIP
jgi:predicted transposase YbfD/YdcC